MNINIQSLDFTARPELDSFVREKVTALSRLKGDIIRGDIALRLDKSDTDENKICEIRLSIPGNDLFAKRNAKSFEEATKMAISALEKQIMKKKDRD
jgi:putative sigma-54 modulation protein